MNYEDELDRSRARKSRRRESERETAAKHHSHETENLYSMSADPGSRAGRAAAKSHGAGSHNHKRRKNGNKKKKIIIGVLIALIVLVLGFSGAVYAYIQHNFGKMNGQNEFDLKDVLNENISLEMRDKMEKGYWTIAVFGLDSRDGSTGKGSQSDVIMIANLNRETGEIKLASVFRDTYLNVSDKNTYNKINAAYALGGPEQAVKALNKNLDLNITHYVAFNWKAVATAINILGGVDIDISKSEFYYINAFITETVKGTGIGSVQLKSAGVNHLDGVQAVAYGRLRLMDSDYARTERQRLVIQKAFEKAKKADFATLNSLVGNMSAMCATNINVNDLLPMVKNITKYHLGDSMGFPAARGEKKIKIGKNNAACVIPQTLVSNVTSLHNFLYAEENYTPSSTVQTISSKIASATGLSKAGKEIDHVATDQGYIPKGATESTTLSAEEESKKESQEESQMESMLNESRKESESTKETETGPDGKPIETSSGSHESSSAAYETDEHGNIYVKPTESHAASPTDEAETSTEAFHPSNPQETTAEVPVGPGYEHSTAAVPEATTSAGPASQSEAQSSVTVPGGAVAPEGPAAGVSRSAGGPESRSCRIMVIEWLREAAMADRRM